LFPDITTFRSSGSSGSGGSTSGLGSSSTGKNGPGSSQAKSDSRQNDDSEESGVGHEEEEEIQQLLIELLSNIKTPKVSHSISGAATFGMTTLNLTTASVII
jgi:hypothetical protein